jgi:hypothetical protein
MSNEKQAEATDLADRISNELVKLISSIPDSKIEKSETPKKVAKALTEQASKKAAALAGGLALPTGPWGLLTILPDLVMVWKIQSQLVADIAAVNGKTAELSREAMVYCLFRHGAAQLMRDMIVRAGGRVFIRRATLRFIQKLLRSIGIRLTQRIIGRTISRFIPLLGAGAVAAYAWYDTKQVAESAQNLFSQTGSIHSEDEPVEALDADFTEI